MSKLITETVRKVFEVNDRWHFTVAPDTDDGLCVQVSYIESETKKEQVTFSPLFARAIADAIIKCADEIEAEDAK